ncbi:MAG: DNA-processing protein DprA [Candidatus Magasanikbacteria bacterium]
MQKEVILSYFPKITNKRFKDLCNNYSSWQEIKNITFNDLNSLGWKKEAKESFFEWRKQVDIEEIKQELKQENIECVTISDENYPKLLKEIHDPPFCLFKKGEIKKEEFALGIVGTRKNSKYGKQVTYKIVKKLARSGVTIVSGMAYGIDSFAHKATMQANGRTIAVLGGGLDEKNIYPAEHRDLAEEIVDSSGAVVTEYCPGTSPSQYTFPQRNRIISGLSHGVLVVEAGESSGALITADSALDQNREVLAIPHRITDKNGVGVNQLIREGATPVTCPEDIFNEFHLEFDDEQDEIEPENKKEAEIIEFLSEEPIHIDKIVKKTNLNSSEVTSTLSILEMKGVVKNLGNMKYAIT